MTHRILTTEEERELFITFLRSRKLPQTVSAVDGRDRSMEQNKLMWLWAAETGQQIGETPDEVQRRWKLHHGVPILREDDDDFRAFYDRHLKRLTYSEKLEAIRFIPVTSDMNVRQMVRFHDAVQRECLEQGLKLTDPDPALATYHARYRNQDRKAA